MFKLKGFKKFVAETLLKGSPIQMELREKYGDAIEKLFIFETQDALELNVLRIHSHMRGKGYAKKIMQRLIDYADDYGKIVHLTPADDWGSDVKRLTKFYKGFGFVMNKGKNRDHRYRDTMIRYPEDNDI